MQVLNNGINNLWPTPVYKTSMDVDLCDRVLTVLLQYVDLASNKQNNLNSLFQLNNPVINEFKSEVDRAFGEYFDKALNKKFQEYQVSYRAWTSGYHGPWSMPAHNHASSPFVSLFYLFAQSDHDEGKLRLHDPRTNANRGYTEEFQEMFQSVMHTPITGDVLVFPGYLYHAVDPFKDKLRIAIPVDLFLDGKDASDDF